MRRFLRRLVTLVSRLIRPVDYFDGPEHWGELFVRLCLGAELLAGRIAPRDLLRRSDQALAADTAHNRWAGLRGPKAYWFNALTPEEEQRLSDWRARQKRRVLDFVNQCIDLAEYDAQSLADPCPDVPAVDTPWRRLAQGYRRICDWLDEG